MEKQMKKLILIMLLVLTMPAMAKKDKKKEDDKRKVLDNKEIVKPVEIGEFQLLQQAHSACTYDLGKFCTKVTEGKAREFTCLFAHADQLKPDCEENLFYVADIVHQQFENIYKIHLSCRNDIRTYCSDIKEGTGRVIDCLRNNFKGISDVCYKELKEIVGIRSVLLLEEPTKVEEKTN